MSIYAIGDVQGCLQPLLTLLKLIRFDPETDTLWFAGDIINRGPDSLGVLRFIKELGPKHITVLGNHDLHLLAVAAKCKALKSDDTLTAILDAPDKDLLLDWLRHQPLFYQYQQYVLVHAGLAPMWTVQQAALYAKEVENVLQSDNYQNFLPHIYSNAEEMWSPTLTDWPRLRCIFNYFTRMRFCYADGRLNFNFKGELGDQPANLFAWFDLPDRQNQNAKIIFGHWSALKGHTSSDNVIALDTGCVWGNCLTAFRLEDNKRFIVPC